MILASHNSLTYYKPQWYLRPLAWIGRCQSKTIQEQYELGVRYFDIRIKYNGMKAISGHGLLTYNISVDEILDQIELYKDCVVRLTLENPKATDEQESMFFMDCQYWEDIYKNIIFVGGYQKGTWKNIFEFTKDCPHIPLEEYYWLFNRESKFPLIKFFAKMRNTLLKDAFTTHSCYLMLDFVEL